LRPDGRRRLRQRQTSILLAVLLTLLAVAGAFSRESQPPDSASVQALIARFRDKDPFANGAAIAGLVKLDSAAVEELIAALQDREGCVRECSALALAKIAPAGPKAIPALIAALGDSTVNVRWYAAVALGQHGAAARRARPALIRLLHEQDDEVRWAAGMALRKIDPGSLPPPLRSAVTGSLEARTPQLMQELHVPGVAMVLIEKNAIRWSRAFGLADAQRKIPVDSCTLFEACSMSKPVFAALALMLVAEGKLQLDQPLCTYHCEEFISEDPAFATQITARMVLAHTSGLPNWRKGGEEREGPLPIFFKPGSRFSYSGEGYYYLQRVMEDITGEPLAVLARRLLFDKLGLASSSYQWSAALDPHIATGHDASGGCLPRSRYLHANAAYTLYTTAEDYARMMIALMRQEPDNGGLLSSPMRREMCRHQVCAETREVINRPGRYFGLSAWRGLGWGIDVTLSGDILYHSGANQTGFRCYAQYDQRDGSGLVIMTNGANGGELWGRLIAEIGDW